MLHFLHRHRQTYGLLVAHDSAFGGVRSEVGSESTITRSGQFSLQEMYK